MTKVAPIRPVTHEPNPHVIAMLKGFLEDAERGDIVSLAAVAVKDGGIISSGYEVQGGDLSRLLGAFQFLKAEILAAAVAEKKRGG